MFAFPFVSFIPKKSKNGLLLSIYDDDKIDDNTGKPDMIVVCNNKKYGVDGSNVI